MTTPEDCHRKAGEWLNAAQATADPKTSASMRRVSDLWLVLAKQIDQTTSTEAHYNSVAMKPADIGRRESFRRLDTVDVADTLRHRLSLRSEPQDELNKKGSRVAGISENVNLARRDQTISDSDDHRQSHLSAKDLKVLDQPR